MRKSSVVIMMFVFMACFSSAWAFNLATGKEGGFYEKVGYHFL